MFSEVSRPRLAWWVVGAVLAFLVGTALLAFTGALVTALFLYYVSRPVYRRIRPRVGRSLAAAGAMLALAVPVVLLVTYTVLIGLQELQTLAQTVDLGPIQQAVSPYFDASGAVQDPASLLQNDDFLSAVQVVLEGASNYLPLVLGFLLNLFVALAVTFYLLRDGSRLATWVRETFDSDAGVLDDYARAVDEDLASVYFGNILNAVLAAVIAATTYYVLNLVAPAGSGVPYPALLGMLVGAASLIPVVGMKIVYPPIAVLLFSRAVSAGDPLWFPVAFFVASAVVVDFIPDIVLRPYVSGRNLHVGLVMIAYVVGPVFFGWYGLFLGPLLLVLVFHFGRIVLPELIEYNRFKSSPAGERHRGDAPPRRADPLPGALAGAERGVRPGGNPASTDDRADEDPDDDSGQ